MYDLIIVGGGPAGSAAGVYAARKKLKTIMITSEFGGQSTVSPNIQNWIGTPSISGQELTKKLREHLEVYTNGGLELKEGEKVSKINKDGATFVVSTDKDEYKAKTVLIVSGSRRRKIPVPGAEELEHKGLTYCATCDGPLFSDMDVVVIGGGNAGFETASQLLAYTKSVTLLQRSNQYKADAVTVEKVLANPKMTGILNAETVEIKGDKFVSGMIYKDTTTEENHEIKAQGIFVEIGQVPNTDFAADLLKLNDYKQIEVDPKNQRSSVDGIWAAGDTTNGLYHQNNIAVGDAIKALEDIYSYIHLK